MAAWKIARLIAFFPGQLCFKSENVKVKVKYGFLLHTGLGQGQFCIHVNTAFETIVIFI